ncbi:GNAT family N-acetyltransferase [Kribbella sp. NPDC048915]|uniref:GNAT family N-acetyltransferase n=1 Tax=Kribbella sp. NPDC048915 TaxID=3155148 RepID=UPI0033EC7F50
MTSIRPADPADAGEIARVYVASWNQGFGELMPPAVLTAERVARWRETVAGGNWWVAEYDGEFAGFVGIGDSRDPVEAGLGELDTIAVDPAYWRHGVGTALLRKALGELAAQYDQAILWTLADYPQGQNFYVKSGWTLTDTTRADGTQLMYRHKLQNLKSAT